VVYPWGVHRVVYPWGVHRVVYTGLYPLWEATLVYMPGYTMGGYPGVYARYT